MRSSHTEDPKNRSHHCSSCCQTASSKCETATRNRDPQITLLTEALDFRPPPWEITVQFEFTIIIKHVWIGILALWSGHLRVLSIFFKDLFLWVSQGSLKGCTEKKSFVLKFLEEVRTYHSNFIFFLIVNIFLNNIRWSFSRQTSKLGMHLLLAFNGNSTIHCHIFTLKISPTGMQVFIWAGLILYRRKCQDIHTTCQ